MTETVKYTHFELAIQKRVASSTWNIGKTSRALELGHWETSRALELGHWENESRARVGTLGNESRARVGAFRNSRPRARMIICRDHDRQHFHPA